MNQNEPIKVSFYDKHEIRMGSPFFMCNIKLEGKYIPKIEMKGYLDVFKWDDTFSYLALAKWYTTNNKPAFHIYIIDIKLEQVVKSKLIEGCCDKIDYHEHKFTCSIFRDIKTGYARISVALNGTLEYA